MNQPVLINNQYILRVYASNAILFNRVDRYNYRILNQIETDILKCVDGERSLPEITSLLCKTYSIRNIEERKSEVHLLKRYLDNFFRQGILFYGTEQYSENECSIELSN